MYLSTEALPAAPHAAPQNSPDAEIEEAVRRLIIAAGDDPAREGLKDTPGRVRRAYREWFAGYGMDPAAILAKRFDAEEYAGVVLLRDIPLLSTCEHHLAPIRGVAHVAYLPRTQVVGISKLARLVEAFALRLQLQERLTRQVAHAIHDELSPRGVGVVVEASHGCMTSRGVRAHGVTMLTECWLGAFEEQPELRGLMRRGGAEERG